MRLLLSLWALGVALAACSGGSSSSPTPSPSSGTLPKPSPLAVGPAVPAPTSLSCTSGSSLTYENFGEGFLLNYCNMCHSSQVSGSARQGTPTTENFDTIAEVQLWRTSMLTDLGGGASPMPPSWTVAPTDLSNANEWLNCGAPTADDKNHLP